MVGVAVGDPLLDAGKVNRSSACLLPKSRCAFGAALWVMHWDETYPLHPTIPRACTYELNIGDFAVRVWVFVNTYMQFSRRGNCFWLDIFMCMLKLDLATAERFEYSTQCTTNCERFRQHHRDA